MRQLVYTSLLLIIALCFTCGERKTRSAIKKSQNIRNIIVETGGGITPVGLRHNDELGFDNYFIEGTRYQIAMVS